MGMIDGEYVESRSIQGVPLLGMDAWAPPCGSIREAELYARFRAAMDAARTTPDTWVLCDQQYTFPERVARFLGFDPAPKYLRQAVILDSVSGRFIFVLARDVEDARNGQFHSKFKVVRPSAVSK